MFPRYQQTLTTMKLPLHQTILLSAALSSVDGFSPPSPHGPPTASALRTSADTSRIFGDAKDVNEAGGRRPASTRLYYEQPDDSTPPGTDTGSGEEVGIWTVLSNTEKWIAATLERSNRAAAPGRPAGQNPYSRKEVSYVCETVQDLPAVVASAFRRVKDARETGEAHGSEQEHILAERGEKLAHSYSYLAFGCFLAHLFPSLVHPANLYLLVSLGQFHSLINLFTRLSSQFYLTSFFIQARATTPRRFDRPTWSFCPPAKVWRTFIPLMPWSVPSIPLGAMLGTTSPTFPWRSSTMTCTVTVRREIGCK